MKKRILSLLLCLCMAATLPGMTLAAEPGAEPGPETVDVSTVFPDGQDRVILITEDGYRIGGEPQVADLDAQADNITPFTALTITGTAESVRITVVGLP